MMMATIACLLMKKELCFLLVVEKYITKADI